MAKKLKKNIWFNYLNQNYIVILHFENCVRHLNIVRNMYKTILYKMSKSDCHGYVVKLQNQTVLAINSQRNIYI